MEEIKNDVAVEGKKSKKGIEMEELRAKFKKATKGGLKFFIGMAVFVIAYLVLGWTENLARLWAESTGHEWLGAPVALIQYIGSLLGF